MSKDNLRFWFSLCLVQPVVALGGVAAYLIARLRGRRAPPHLGLRVGFDGRVLSRTLSGLERYTDELISGLTQSGAECRVYTLRPYTPHPHNPGVIAAEAVNVVRPSARSLHVRLAADLARGEVDLLHIPWADLELTLFMPLLFARRSVLTVHDLILLTRYYTPAQQFVFQALLRWGCRRASAVVTDSEHIRGELIRRIGVTPEKVHVAPLGVDAHFRPVEDPERLRAVREKYGLPPQFILALGRVFPHKNLAFLVRCVARLRERGLTDASLVLAGPRDCHEWLPAFDAACRDVGTEGWFHWLEHVEDADLPALYSAARLFACPSLEEGFGLPPLEAMACGTPVVSSGASSLPEVIGDAGLLADPTDLDAFTAALERVWSDDGLRAELRKRGSARAARFTWLETARRTREVYRQVSGK